MINTPQQRENLGLWLGLLGVVIFGLTLPMTRLATGTVDAPQMSPWFVTWARAALAGGLSLVYLLAVRAPWPLAEQRGPLYLSLAGNVIGYPLLLGWALRHVTASHAAVITALLPLATAAAAAWLLHQRARALWASVLQQFLQTATVAEQRSASDKGPRHRIRFGVYFYEDLQAPPGAKARPAKVPPKRLPRS